MGTTHCSLYALGGLMALHGNLGQGASTPHHLGSPSINSFPAYRLDTSVKKAEGSPLEGITYLGSAEQHNTLCPHPMGTDLYKQQCWTLLIPITSTFLCSIFLGEKLEPKHIIGMGLIMLGLIVMSSCSKQGCAGKLK